jgi:enterochelin esterase family protein
MDAAATLNELQESETIPSVACLFISHLNGEARHYDYTCNQSFADFVANDVIAWLHERNPGVPSAGHLVGGPSLGGLQAAFTAMSHAKTFGLSLSQSGSFWWNNEWLRENLPRFCAENGRFWISVGDKETESEAIHPPTGMRQERDQISATERLIERLGDYTSEIHFHLYDGGHEIRPWKEELPGAIQWLFRKAEFHG